MSGILKCKYSTCISQQHILMPFDQLLIIRNCAKKKGGAHTYRQNEYPWEWVRNVGQQPALDLLNQNPCFNNILRFRKPSSSRFPSPMRLSRSLSISQLHFFFNLKGGEILITREYKVVALGGLSKVSSGLLVSAAQAMIS